jgi:hypothetical protein
MRIFLMRNIRALYRALVPRTLTWSFCVKAEAKLAGLLLRLVPLVFGHLTLSHVKVVWGYAKEVAKMYRAMGSRGTAIYLKTCYLVTQHIAGGMKDQSPWDLGANIARTRFGIPRIINRRHRLLLAKSDAGTIRLWLSLFSLYRVLEFKGRLKLKTITEPGKNISMFMPRWEFWVPVFYEKIRLITDDPFKMDLSKDLWPGFIPFIRKASPNSGGFSAVMSIPWDVALFGSHLGMQRVLLDWLKTVDGLELIWGLKALWKLIGLKASLARDEFIKHEFGSTEWNLKWRSARFLDRHPDAGPLLPGEEPDVSPLYYAMKQDLPTVDMSPETQRACLLSWYIKYYWGKPLWFGRLGFKEEPGKIRVFAMVNILTQTLMAPLHKWIFLRLRKIPTDGTFNQVAPVERLIKRFQNEGTWVASYDLSAATDRLPLALQVRLLVPILGEKMAANWANLLVSQPYGLPRVAKSYNLGFDRVVYAVGQPMGALSSWALLALTHHALVQMAAFEVHKLSGWFLNYAILGDDVVIADRAVARRYLAIMKEIGVDISLAKSLVSNTSSLEFAKRTWVAGRDVTPVSLAEMLVALRSLGALGELVNKNMKFGVIRISSVARFCGFGFRNLARLPIVLGVGNRLSGLVAYLCRPGGLWPMPLEAWLLSVAPGAQEGVVVDPNRWTIATSLWRRTLSGLLQSVVKFERLLFFLSMTHFTDLTVWRKPVQGEKYDPSTARGKGSELKIEKSFFAPSVKEFFGMDRDSVAWNEFFTEWVARPYTNGLRKAHERIDDRLRVYEPGILPAWNTLYDIFTEIAACEEGVNLLPTKVGYTQRLDDEVAPSAKLITLWRRLRVIAHRERISSVSIRKGYVDAPQARRRRRGG